MVSFVDAIKRWFGRGKSVLSANKKPLNKGISQVNKPEGMIALAGNHCYCRHCETILGYWTRDVYRWNAINASDVRYLIGYPQPRTGEMMICPVCLQPNHIA